MPGISALLAAAARLGAPLGHDFCAISLSDNLKPWPWCCAGSAPPPPPASSSPSTTPLSRARPGSSARRSDVCAQSCRPTTPVAFATAVSRPDERIAVTTLAEADPALADMRTLVLIGRRHPPSPAGGRPWLYTPRSAA